MREWLESEDEKSELLKFIEEMKTISIKQSSRTNPLLIKPTNSSENNTTYDELLLFDELLAAEINKNSTNNDNNDLIERANQTNRTNGNTLNWSIEKTQDSNNKYVSVEQITKPVEKKITSKIFDPQNFIERIRKNSNKTYVTSNYELLSCKSQSFLQRLAVLGEILT